MKYLTKLSATALMGAAIAFGGVAAAPAPAQASEPFLGQIMQVGFNFAPRGWATCDGQLLPIGQNQALFSLLGTTYGGDGRTTFALPDLRGRAARHVGTGPGLSPVTWGQRGGSETRTLTIQNLPSHSHTLNAKATNGNQNSPQNNFIAPGGTRTKDFHDNTSAPTAATMNSASIGNNGGGQSVDIRNPYLGIYHVIAIQGLYPSRS